MKKRSSVSCTLLVVSSECVSQYRDLLLSFFHLLGRWPHFTLFLCLFDDVRIDTKQMTVISSGVVYVVSWNGVTCKHTKQLFLLVPSTFDLPKHTSPHQLTCGSNVWPLLSLWCIILLQKGKQCGVFRGEGCNARDTYLFPLGWVFVTFCNQTWCCGAPSWAWMSCKKMGFYLQGQGHSVGLYNQNMTVSTISFISSKPVSLLQPNSIWV